MFPARLTRCHHPLRASCTFRLVQPLLHFHSVPRPPLFCDSISISNSSSNSRVSQPWPTVTAARDMSSQLPDDVVPPRRVSSIVQTVVFRDAAAAAAADGGGGDDVDDVASSNSNSSSSSSSIFSGGNGGVNRQRRSVAEERFDADMDDADHDILLDESDALFAAEAQRLNTEQQQSGGRSSTSATRVTNMHRNVRQLLVDLLQDISQPREWDLRALEDKVLVLHRQRNTILRSDPDARAEDPIALKVLFVFNNALMANISLAEEPLRVSDDILHIWLEDQLLQMFVLARRLHESRRARGVLDAATPDRPDPSRWLYYGDVMEAVGSMQNGPRYSEEQALRVVSLIQVWSEFVLFKDLSHIADEGVRIALAQVRRELHSEVKEDTGHTKAQQLCTMMIDGILQYVNVEMARVMKIVGSMVAHAINLDSVLGLTLARKSQQMPLADKWRLVLNTDQTDGRMPIPKHFYEYMLRECCIYQDWDTGSSVVEHMVSKGVSVHNPISACFTLSILERAFSVAESLRFWAQLPETIKWNGRVLNEMLGILLVRRSIVFVDFVTEILHRSRTVHDGEWPTRFFHTPSQLDRFRIASKHAFSRLKLHAKKQKNDTYRDLASEWRQFSRRHVEQHKGEIRLSRIMLSRQEEESIVGVTGEEGEEDLENALHSTLQ